MLQKIHIYIFFKRLSDPQDLNMGDDWAVPLITEVFSFSYTCFSGFSLTSFPFSSSQFSSHFQALQKICLTNHIRSMADLLHTDAMQQLVVALMGSPTA